MFKFRRHVAFFALACVCVLAACDDTPPAPQATAPAASKKPSKVSSIDPAMVAAVSAGKASNVISLHFALRATPTVNTALPMDVAVVPHREFNSLSAHFDGQDGLAVTSGVTLDHTAQVEVESPLSHQLVLLPTKEGMFVVTASVETDGAEGKVTRIFSIPIIVGPAAGPAPAASPAQKAAKQ